MISNRLTIFATESPGAPTLQRHETVVVLWVLHELGSNFCKKSEILLKPEAVENFFITYFQSLIKKMKNIANFV
jgi:hypothetical protein